MYQTLVARLLSSPEESVSPRIESLTISWSLSRPDRADSSLPSAGIGAEIVEQLAAHGAKVYLGARSKERAEAAIERIEQAHPDVREKSLLIWLPMDLLEPVDIVKSAQEFMRREEKLDMLGMYYAEQGSNPGGL